MISIRIFALKGRTGKSRVQEEVLSFPCENLGKAFTIEVLWKRMTVAYFSRKKWSGWCRKISASSAPWTAFFPVGPPAAFLPS